MRPLCGRRLRFWRARTETSLPVILNVDNAEHLRLVHRRVQRDQWRRGLLIDYPHRVFPDARSRSPVSTQEGLPLFAEDTQDEIGWQVVPAQHDGAVVLEDKGLRHVQAPYDCLGVFGSAANRLLIHHEKAVLEDINAGIVWIRRGVQGRLEAVRIGYI